MDGDSDIVATYDVLVYIFRECRWGHYAGEGAPLGDAGQPQETLGGGRRGRAQLITLDAVILVCE